MVTARDWVGPPPCCGMWPVSMANGLAVYPTPEELVAMVAAAPVGVHVPSAPYVVDSVVVEADRWEIPVLSVAPAFRSGANSSTW